MPEKSAKPKGPDHYWVFISYSHSDDNWGKWLHKSLESYRVPRRLVGRQHPNGLIPKRLFPVFRDRDELPSSAELGEAIDEALLKSRYQVVICSPHAAASRWVNEEIRRFKMMGRDDRILALIVDGEPNADQAAIAGQPECFPPALRHELDDFGKTTIRRRELIAADARGGRDGRRDALLKIISGVLEVSFDELKQRERTRARWLLAGYAAIATAVLLALGGVWQWQVDLREKQTRAELIARDIELGRKELEGDHPARAATYFADAYSHGEDSISLRYLLARAMRGVDPMVRSFRNDPGGGWLSGAFSPDGKRVVVGGALSNVATVWDVETAEAVQRFDQQTWIGSVGYRPDGQQVWTTSGDRIVLWDVKSGAPTATVLGEAVPGTFLRVLYAPDSSQFFTYDPAGEIRSYDGRSGALRHVFKPAVTPDEDWVLSRDGALLASAMGQKVQLWDAASGRDLGQLEGHEARVMSVDFSPDASLVVTADTAGVVLLWERSTRKLAARLRNSGDEVWALFGNSARRLMVVNRMGFTQWIDVPLPAPAEGQATVLPAGPWLSPDGDWTSWAIAGNTFQLGSARSGQRVLTLEGHSAEVIDTRFAPSGLHVLSLARDGTAKLWDPPPDERRVLRDDEDLLYAAYSADGKSMVSLNVAGEVHEWDAITGAEKRVMVPRGTFGHRGALSSDARRAVLVDREGFNALLDAATGRLLGLLEGRDAIASFSANGKRLLTVDALQATVWDAANANLLRDEARGEASGASRTGWAALSPDGETLALLRADGTVRLLPAAGGQGERVLTTAMEDTTSLQWGADRSRLVTFHSSGRIRIHDVAADRLDHELALSTDCTSPALHMSPSRPIAVIVCGAIPFVWHFETRSVLPLSGHSADVEAVAFSPDGTRIATGAQDATVRIWDVMTGQSLDTLTGHSWTVHQLAFSPDGRWLLSASFDRSLRQWEMIEPETRSPAQIEQVMQCKSTWKLVQGKLRTRRPDPMPCAEARAPD